MDAANVDSFSDSRRKLDCNSSISMNADDAEGTLFDVELFLDVVIGDEDKLTWLVVMRNARRVFLEVIGNGSFALLCSGLVPVG